MSDLMRPVRLSQASITPLQMARQYAFSAVAYSYSFALGYAITIRRLAPAAAGNLLIWDVHVIEDQWPGSLARLRCWRTSIHCLPDFQRKKARIRRDGPFHSNLVGLQCPGQYSVEGKCEGCSMCQDEMMRTFCNVRIC